MEFEECVIKFVTKSDCVEQRSICQEIDNKEAV